MRLRFAAIASVTSAMLLSLACSQQAVPPTGNPPGGNPGGAGGTTSLPDGGTPVDPTLVPLDLAGRRLGGAPHFTAVRSFHDSDVAQLAVSPVAVPAITGQTCDLVVVENRSAAAWQTDRSLLDVRGQARTHTFSGSDIASNVVDLVSPGELSGWGARGPGAGYDVVVDCDQDGLLGPGDLVDGLGDEAGFYVVPDLTQRGPRDVTTITHTAGPWLDQIIYHPSDLANDGAVPLVVVAHGFGHQKEYYDHLGAHLASYGYVVASIANDVGSGADAATETASTTLLNNTDHLLDQQAAIGGGVLDGHLDASRIVWMGHSTGGECVVRAYTRLREGDYQSAHFTASDIALVSSIAPVAFLPASRSNPYDVSYHLITGGADHDTGNYPEDGYTQNMALFERATGDRHLVYVHGAGHGDLHNGSQNDLDQPDPNAPDLIGPQGAHPVLLGYSVALVERTTRENPAMLDFFERSHDDFRPAGIPSHVVLSTEYRPALAAGHFVLDDFQTAPDLATSSSGGAVSADVSNAAEVLMSDHDWSFDWTGAQPSNGMTRNLDPGDDARCLVFDWATGDSKVLELEVVPAQRDLTDDRLISFRAAQGTRHPETDALDADLSFTVTLRDQAGTTSSIDFGRYGRITRTYRRPGSGSGAGWANEFNTIHIPLADFVTNEPQLDLGAVVAVRFEFGASYGSPRGRIALDDVMVLR